jgi:hypothetical protein
LGKAGRHLAAASAVESRLILCSETAEYVQAVAAAIDGADYGAVPVLAGASSDLKGFGDIAVRPAAFRSGGQREASSLLKVYLEGNAARGEGEALCLAHPDMLPSAAAGLLCRGLGKKSVALPRDPARVGKALQSALRRRPCSMTLIAPPLLTSGTAWFAEVIAALRAAAGSMQVLPPWGIIAAPDGAGLTMLAAKAVLHRAIFAAYDDGARCFIDDNGMPSRARRRSAGLPGGRDLAKACGFDLVSTTWLCDERATALAARKHDVLIVNGHGRSYCGAGGLLCAPAHRHRGHTGRRMPECVCNMSCAAPEFLRIDPRRLDARVMVAITCDAANLNGTHWQAGDPSVAFLAAQGYSSAVITTDGVVIERDSALLEFMVAHAESSTVGECARLLSDLMAGPNLAASFYVLGDPDIPLRGKHEELVVTVETDEDPSTSSVWHGRTRSGGAPVARMVVDSPAPAPDDVLYAWGKDERAETRRAVIRADGETLSCWMLATNGKVPPETEFSLAFRAPAGIAPAIVQAAEHALACAPELLMPELANSWEHARRAARHIIATASDLQERTGRIRLENPSLLDARVAEAEARWAIAQAALMSRMDALNPGYMWPYNLWRVDVEATDIDATICPVCGNPGLVRRRYRTGTRGARHSFDCVRCCRLVDDRPADEPAVFGVEAPHQARPGEPIEVRFRLTNPSPVRSLFCAGYISMRPLGHGLAPRPAVLTGVVPPRSERILKMSFVPAEDEAHAHVYALRAALLADMVWHWQCRPLIIA